MTSKDWLNKVRENADKLRSLIGNYHPAFLKRRRNSDQIEQSITAPDAERACEVVRGKIRKEHLGDPIQQFTLALDAGDIPTIGKLLNAAWFGVPESTSCWRIEGFAEAVDLLDDPPDDVEYED